MRKGELREKAVYGISDVISEIASEIENIMDYINGAKGLEPDSEILETVNADIEDLWSSLNEDLRRDRNAEKKYKVQ